MKNLVILGLMSLLLFSISAGLSIWLRQSSSEAMQTEEKAEKDKAATAEAPKEADKNHSPAEPSKRLPEPLPPTTSGVDTTKRDQVDKIKKHDDQTQIVLQDLRIQQELVDNLTRQVVVETKAALARAEEADTKVAALQNELTAEKKASEKATEAKAAELKKTQAETEAAMAKNIDKLATIYEAMSADKAAVQIQEMANSGNLDAAVKVLSKMKERQAARVLAELPDLALANQITTKILQLKRPIGTSPVP